MSELTHVELVWVKNRIENWIRFGHTEEEHVLDTQRRIMSFTPGSVFAFVRWAANDYGTIVSRINILRAVGPGERYSTVPHVRPGGESLLHLGGWAKVEKVLQAIDAVEALGIDPADAAPDYWRHVHNRLSVGERPRAYTRTRHQAWLRRRELGAMTARAATLITMATALALLLFAASKPAPLLVWNASESAPLGLYRVQPAGKLTITELVVAMPPEAFAAFLFERGYLPRDVPLLKRIVALPSQAVCRNGLRISVDGIEIGAARERDRHGRALPRWEGCRVLADGEVFVMNADEPASLDSRYFGPIPASAIVGRAAPLWTFRQH